ATLILELFAADLGLNPSSQYVERVRLRNIVVRARAETFDQRLPVLDRRQQDKWDIAQRRRGLDATTGLLTTEARNREFQQDAVDVLNGQDLNGLLARVGQDHVIAFVTQGERKLLQVLHALIHGQNALRTRQIRCGHEFRMSSSQYGCKTRENDVHVFVLAHEGIRPGLQRL